MASPAMSLQPGGWGGSSGANPTPWTGNEFVSSGSGGANQWTNFPSLMPPSQFSQPLMGGSGLQSVNSSAPGTVPQAPPGASINPLTDIGSTAKPGMTNIGKGNYAQNPLDPELTSALFSYLQGQVGQGVAPFDLSALLPSSGQATGAGQLSAPLTQLLQQMQQNYGSSGQIGQMASQGVDATPAWQKMVTAQGQNIEQNQANLQEQFNKFGNLASSPSAIGMANFQEQTTKDQNALLGQLQFQGIGDQLQAGNQVAGFGQMMQGLDQSSIDRLLQEFTRTQSQNNPTLGMQYGASTTFPPVINPKSGGGLAGAAIGASGGILSGLSDILPFFGL